MTSGGGEVAGHFCRGRRPRRPAEGSRPLPTMWKVRGWLWEVRGPGMPGPYGVAERETGAYRKVRGRDESLPYGVVNGRL